MIWVIGVGGLLWLGIVAWLERPRVDEDEAHRNRVNLHARQVHVQAGNKSYPHLLADGRVRWYRTDHDPVEL